MTAVSGIYKVVLPNSSVAYRKVKDNLFSPFYVTLEKTIDWGWNLKEERYTPEIQILLIPEELL